MGTIDTVSIERDEPKLASNFDKFRLLMWKNYLIQRRNPIKTILEILTPASCCIILIAIRNAVSPEIFPNNTFYSPFDINTMDPLRARSKDQGVNIKEWKLIYSPENSVLENLVNTVSKSLKLDGSVGLKTSNDIAQVMVNRKLVAGIEFEHPANLTELPINLKYKLRFPSESRTPRKNESITFNWQTNLLFPLISSSGPRDEKENSGGLPYYFDEGFIPIQDAIARAFVQLKCADLASCENDTLPNIKMQRFPYPPYIFDILLQGLETIVSFFILLSFVYPCINTVDFITTEKERQLKETMKIMGLPCWLHWTSWFMWIMMFMIISISLMVALLKTDIFGAVAVFQHSEWSTIWMFLFVYSISMVTFCFMFSALFSKADIGSTVAGLMWFLLYLPFTLTQTENVVLARSIRPFLLLLSNTAMALGFQIILRFEGTGEGLQWSNFFKPVHIDSDLTVGTIMIYIMVESFVYLLIALYVEKVKSGDFGISEKWYFPFTVQFWCGRNEFSDVENSFDLNSLHDPQNFEPYPRDRRAGVKIKNIRKVYPNQKVACKGLTLNVFESQITVLLGHNGAGKTTTMSMLTGMIPPTSGTALINGHDIRKDLQKARSSIGLCPQHNILFDELTVREHIEFYATLKGLNKKDVKDEVTKYVQLLELQPKIDALSASLSGGMKRKLSMGVALCGGSKVVFCDEPTSGMDPAARRALWDLLQREKMGRTILLTTHFMDEADVLGDRIAIMADGELKCCGSSFFLKKRFGTGYRLVCVKDEGCDSKTVTNTLREYVPGVQIQEDIASELTYSLSDEYVDRFDMLFQNLENNQESLKLLSFGVSLTTLEEVFLKVGCDSICEKSENPVCRNDRLGFVFDDFKRDFVAERAKGFRLLINQWLAMFKKRFTCLIRNKVLLLLVQLIQISFVAMSVFVIEIRGISNNLNALDLSFEPYDKTVTMLEMPQTFNNSQMKNILTAYRRNIGNSGPDNTLDEFNEDIQMHFLELAKTMLVRLNEQYLGGMSLGNDTEIIAWFNNQPFHASALSINLVHNAIIKSNLGPEFSIHVSNHPLPFTIESSVVRLNGRETLGFQLSSNLPFAMAFISAFSIIFYITERATKSKHLQFVSGLNVFTYWITSFLFDLATYLLNALILMLELWAFQQEGWRTMKDLTPIYVVLIFFGLSILPVIYLSSMFFSVSSTGFVRMSIFFILTGDVAFTTVWFLNIPAFGLQNTAEILRTIFSIFPHYSLADSLYNLNNITVIDQICRQKCAQFPNCQLEKMCQFIDVCCGTNIFALQRPGIGQNLTFMAVVGILCFSVLLIIEYRVFESVIYYVRSSFERKLPPVASTTEIDNDIDDEKKRVEQMTVNDLKENNLVLKSLSKFHGDLLAVNQISIGIKSAECFGLLGANGAGKTSTFKMLTGDKKISSGEAYVCGVNLKSNMREVHKMIGYCPQFDALLDDLTGAETLEQFALLRGIHPKDIPILSKQLATDLNFTKHINKKVGQYSGGNKRKLSTAIALIGNPIVVYLDEPTSGMDAGAKRHLWNMVSKVRNLGKSIVLTSHSMEECEALCTRLAIMVDGEFKCLGSTQHLKNKFSKGFTLTIKTQQSGFDVDSQVEDTYVSGQLILRVIQLKEFVKRNFWGANLMEEYQGMLTFYVPPNDTLKWSSMFGLMETAKRTLHIEDYSISQTSLEQVFLSFTKYQDDENNCNANTYL